MKLLVIICFILSHHFVNADVKILSKSKLEKCERSGANAPLNCTKKIVIDMAVPSEASGKEASIVAEVSEVEEKSSDSSIKTLRNPPVITINKSAAYAQYELTYIRDVPYRPEELYVKTRKCEPYAGANIVQYCESLRDERGCIIEHTQPTCCPCGKWRRVPSSCGNFFNKMRKGKTNTAHCLRFPGDWFHVFGIGQHSVGFNIRISVKTGPKTSEVIIGPNNRTASSLDNFLRVNLVGDFVGYNSIPSFENFFLVIPRQADQNRIKRNQVPLYDVLGRFQRINEHPDARSHSFSLGIDEVVNSNLLIELSADDIEYVYQRSPGNIISITIPTFEALTQYGTATIATNNTGEVEASYSLTIFFFFNISLQEQFFIMKKNEVVTRNFKVRSSTDQAARYVCTAILKDSDYHETDRAECQFTTTATVLDNGTQIPWERPKNGGIKGFFDSLEEFWHTLWEGMVDFITGKTCSRFKCSGFFDFHCHIRHICMGWMLLFILFLAVFPTVILLIWLLHETGVFDPFYDWWEDHFWDDQRKIQHIKKHRLDDWDKHPKKKSKHHADDTHKREGQQKGVHHAHKHNHPEHHHVKREKHKHERIKGSSFTQHPLYVNKGGDDIVGERRWIKKREVTEEAIKYSRHDAGTEKTTHKHGHDISDDIHHKHFHSKRRT
ncbi:hypothetical protein R6Q57_018723 [Mikania cordata]